MPAGSATKLHDLRTGVPIWLPDGDRSGLGAMPRESLTADVVIIGGGISGALLADAALNAGRQVVAIDRRGFGLGSTAASTALLQFELDMPLIQLTERVGAERAARAWWRSAAALDVLRGRIADLGLRCGFRERHTAYLPGNILDTAGLKEEAAARSRIGLRSRYVTGDELRDLTGIERRGAIWSAGAAELDPVKLTRGLWRSARERGAVLLSPADVQDISPTQRSVTLTLHGGIEIRAHSAALATGYELPRMLKPRGYRVISTWAMATWPQRRRLWPTHCLIWEAADPYLYLRTTLDHRILIGGEDEDFVDEDSRDALIPRKIETLRRKLGRLLPEVDDRADFAWTGCFGASATSLPAIGPVLGAPRCFAVLGYGGNGTTFSVIAAQMFQRWLLGLSDPDRDIFGLD
ncbi:FAD-binding oxidoreductase [Roseomonas terrae]|uniref:FAD-binding oxidoreductase n=1 Tax=Neoroseomonas terrae TaxID=424799 RepID=A0ABS5EEU6_9PROT|nr:FAD-dependent oxidoreductase [Neoroseomonas terrae]MBR0649549.1 FAD-binding oxidoreductase [Neoroseomonas terrae]